MKLLKLLALGLLPMSPLVGSIVFLNSDFGDIPPESNWAIALENNSGGPLGAGDINTFVDFSAAPVATFAMPSNSGTNVTIANFYQQFEGVFSAGVTYTFSADISNVVFPGTSIGYLMVKTFAADPPTLTTRTQFRFTQIFATTDGTVSVDFTPNIDGSDSIVWLGLVFNNRGTLTPSADFSNPTVIPEPRTYALLFGILGLGFVLYRRRR
ncbi:MAG: PEP-CTERM sorting domain-containing protein [Opitutales bacterium]|nr:PEP-CTERM sorting domain-containing protein [Opitutales bacterium]